MKPLRILHVNNIANVASIIATEQRLNGNIVFLRELATPLAQKRFFLKFVGLPLRFYDSLKIRRSIRKNNIDIVHVHFISSAVFLLFTGKPLIIHAHGSDIRIDNFFSIRKLINHFILKNCNFLFYSTPDLEKYASQYKVPSIFIPNPIDLDNFYERNPPSSNSILLYSSVSKIKGAKNAMNALLQFKKMNPMVKITCFNYGDEFDIYKNLPFDFIEKQKRENLPKIICDHELIIGQTFLGAIGMSELEALACERPVLTFFEYQNSYTEPAPIINVKDATQILNVLNDYISNPQKYSRENKARREWVEKFHHVKNICKLIEKKYLEILQS